MFPNTLFSIFGLEIDLYAILLTLGIVLCVVSIMLLMKREGFKRSARDAIIFIGFIAIIIGILSATLFQSIYDFMEDPTKGFKITGRMTFIGGLIGGIISYILIYLLYTKLINPRLKDTNLFKANMNKGIFELLVIVPIGITIAHGVGRIGCFFAGCCYGVETHAWYGIKFATTETTVIPTQLFEAIFLLVLSGIMFLLYYKFNFKYNLGLYGISYGIWRFIIEFFRGDDRGGKILGLSPSQFWSILLVLGGIAFIFIYRYFLINKSKEQSELQTNEK